MFFFAVTQQCISARTDAQRTAKASRTATALLTAREHNNLDTDRKTRRSRHRAVVVVVMVGVDCPQDEWL